VAQTTVEAAPAAPARQPIAPAPASRHTLAEDPEQAYRAPQAAAVPAWETVENGYQADSAVPIEPPKPAPAFGKVAPSKATAGWLLGIFVAVLLAAGGGWAWYAHAHRCANCAATSTVAPQPGAALTTAQGVPPATPAAKPSAGTAATGASHARQASIVPAPKPIPAPLPLPPAQNSASGGHGNPAAPTPAFLPTPAPKPIQNVAGRSGVEHYQGPPVPHGGQVVFHNLPKARLKFSFDNTAWRLTLKPNPDGTKEVILTSLIQGAQTNCDLGWQVVE